MKEILDKIKENSQYKTIAFFCFYLVFFIILFCIISFRGDKDYLHQEYEKGNSFNNKGVLNKNFLYDYKITVDGVLYDYYGKRYGDTESFKYNNEDYYQNEKHFYVHHEEWEEVDNPYLFYEIIDYDSLTKIMSQATYIDRKELEEEMEFTYFISSNSLNSILYDKETDYDEEADTIVFATDKDNNITKITYQLNHLCSHLDNCGETLTIEMKFEMFGSVSKIDNPIR